MSSFPISWTENSWQRHSILIYLNMCSKGQPSGQALWESLEFNTRVMVLVFPPIAKELSSLFLLFKLMRVPQPLVCTEPVADLENEVNF